MSRKLLRLVYVALALITVAQVPSVAAQDLPTLDIAYYCELAARVSSNSEVARGRCEAAEVEALAQLATNWLDLSSEAKLSCLSGRGTSAPKSYLQLSRCATTELRSELQDRTFAEKAEQFSQVLPAEIEVLGASGTPYGCGATSQSYQNSYEAYGRVEDLVCMQRALEHELSGNSGGACGLTAQAYQDRYTIHGRVGDLVCMQTALKREMSF